MAELPDSARVVHEDLLHDVAVVRSPSTFHAFKKNRRRRTANMMHLGRDSVIDTVFDIEMDAESLSHQISRAEAEFDRRSSLAPAAPGKYHCILAPQVAAVILHEVVGHIIEPDIWRTFSQTHGVPVFDSALEITANSPRTPIAWTHAPVDDAGRQIVPTRAVSDGAIRSLLDDGLGNIRRDSWRSPGLSRMRHLTLVRGDGVSPPEPSASRPVLHVKSAGHGALSVRSGIAMVEIIESDLVSTSGKVRTHCGNYLRMPALDLLAALRPIASDIALETRATDDEAIRSICLKANQQQSVSFESTFVYGENLEII